MVLRWALRLGGALIPIRTEGIATLRKTAAVNGRLLQPFARLLLAVAALRNKDKAAAQKNCSKDSPRRFPHNRFIRHRTRENKGSHRENRRSSLSALPEVQSTTSPRFSPPSSTIGPDVLKSLPCSSACTRVPVWKSAISRCPSGCIPEATKSWGKSNNAWIEASPRTGRDGDHARTPRGRNAARTTRRRSSSCQLPASASPSIDARLGEPHGIKPRNIKRIPIFGSRLRRGAAAGIAPRCGLHARLPRAIRGLAVQWNFVPSPCGNRTIYRSPTSFPPDSSATARRR